MSLAPWGSLPEIAEVRIGDADCLKGPVFSVEVARTPEEQSRGLGGRQRPLAENEGMLFAYRDPAPVRFWMKETRFPLAIAFFDAAGMLAGTDRMPVEADPANPRNHYRSPGPAGAVLEFSPEALPEVLALDPPAVLCVKVS